MKKIVNRVFCMLFAVVFLVLSVAELSVVSAESGESSVGTVKLYPSEEEVSKISPPINQALIDSIYNKYKYTEGGSNNSYPNYIYCPDNGKKCLFDISDYKQCFDFAIYFGYCNGVFMRRQVDKKEFYYYAYVYTKTDYFYINIYCSPKPLYFRATDDKTFRLYSEPWVQSCTFVFENKNGTSSVSSSNSLVYSNELESSSCVTYLSSSTSYMSTIDEISDNTINWNRLIIPFQSGDFPNFLSKADKSGVEYYDGVKFSPAQIPLKDQIEVKLTPEFGLDMDRVFDKNTGQNDYFKFEVTNNSDKNIQFCAYIIDGIYHGQYDYDLRDDYNSEHGGSSGHFGDSSVEGDDSYTYYPDNFNLIIKSNWNYITEMQYYMPEFSDDKKFLLFHDYNCYAEMQRGNFYWVLLKPGEHFEDYIYWENINIIAREEYTFVVQCIPTELEYSTNIFYYKDSDGKKHYRYYEDLVAKKDKWYTYDDFTFGGKFSNYGLFEDDITTVYHTKFSCLTMPDFTNKIKGGNAKITSNWSDTQAQSNNPYFKYDTETGQIKPVNNYSEFNGNLEDFNIDINSISPDNVMDYILFPKQFINLIKLFFTWFPGLWALIIFGLTAIIVIGIVRYIRG